MPLQKKLKCPQCSRRFSMPGHLARHMNSIHRAGGPAKRGRKPGTRGRRKWGTRSSGSLSKTGLSNMNLEQLNELVINALDETRQKLKQLSSVFG